MAVKTKQVLENENKTLEARAAKAEKELAEFKEKVARTVAECNEEYSLDLCEDGLEDFHRRLGIDQVDQTREANIHFSLYQVELEGKPTRYGFEFNQEAIDEISDEVERALTAIKSKWSIGGRIDVEVEEY